MKNIIVRNMCLIALLFVVNLLWADIQLPNRAIGRPKIFTMSDQSWRWEKIAAERSWDINGYDNNIWVVYVDREGVKAYENPSSSSNVVKTLSFLEKHYVAKVQGDYALLFESKYSIENLVIDHKNSTAIGWVLVDELLLWSECPRTRNQVYEKAVILKDPEYLKNKSELVDIDEASPKFRKNPKGNIFSNIRANDLEFFFKYKTVDGSALLFEDSNIEKITIKTTKCGWMNSGLYSNWNERLCYEPQFGDDVANNQQAIIFSNREDLKLYLSNEEYNSQAILWLDKLSKERWNSKRVRFPVMSHNRGISQVGTIGSIGGSINPDDGRIREIEERIETLTRKMGNINVVFVLDGTSSMRNYYKPMAEAIKLSMRQTVTQEYTGEIRFGAVVYRNIADGEKEIESKKLTMDYNDVANWLLNCEARSIGSTHSESMFKGLSYAIDNMNWSKETANFLVLIGDAGNVMDKKCIDDISRKMANKDINFIAYQANHPEHEAYHNFVSQTQMIMLKTLEKIYNRRIGKIDFEREGHLRSFINKDENKEIISAGYHYASVGLSESASQLREIFEAKIADFVDLTTDNLKKLQEMLASLGEGEGTPLGDGAVNFLLDQGFSRSEIDVIKQKNLTLKIKGHTSMYSSNKTQVLVPCVFFAAKELGELIESLEKVTNNVMVDKRIELQKALKNLILSYMGQSEDSENITIEDLVEAMYAMGPIAGENILKINIKDISEPYKVSDEKIDEIIKELKIGKDNLRSKLSDPSCYFEKNKKRYYYILAEDMPFFGGN